MFKRKNNKKGFTIVELTIVVSVIAILSAVLIPVFAGVTRKARQTADEAAVLAEPCRGDRAVGGDAQ